MKKAFRIQVNGKLLDYRVGKPVDIEDVSRFFSKQYRVSRIWHGGRHVLAILTRDNTPYFLKLATTEGISALTQNEYQWNDVANAALPEDSGLSVPKNIEQGWYTKEQYYLITDVLSGTPCASGPSPRSLNADFMPMIPRIIDCTEAIQSLPVQAGETDYRRQFLDKVDAWYEAVPNKVRDAFGVERLLDVVREHSPLLVCKARHGDFAPWHLINLDTGKVGLIDGEHYAPNGVAYYDAAYLIQRLFDVMEEPKAATSVYRELLVRPHDVLALQAVLAARGIGGYLDASLHASPDYRGAQAFHAWVLSLK